MMKKWISLFLCMIMLVATCGGCGATATENATDGTGSNFLDVAESQYRVALITDYGDITDQSFNQTTYEACKMFCAENSIDFEYYTHQL